MPSVKHGGGCVMVRKFHNPVPEADPNPKFLLSISWCSTKLHTLQPPPVGLQLQGECLLPPLALLILLPYSSFTSFCAQNRISLTTYNLQHLLAFITDLRLSLNLAPSSIRNYLSGIQHPFRLQSPSPPPAPFNPRGPSENLASSFPSRQPISSESPVSQPSACGALTSLKSPEIILLFIRTSKTDSYIKIQKFPFLSLAPLNAQQPEDAA
ncbi:hypothetical protein EOD39_6184 [Acipenser ruthenus]|uniref:Uncharacterized protein n=1 Tax=Acipenser ruthenus TaxID=7906 RepID=A0A444UB37_ACIRT|nr:hypothetical protein EOD39_6184 [Acipenser ruthenus]